MFCYFDTQTKSDVNIFLINLSKFVTQCRRWDSSKWTNEDCATTSSLVTVNNTDYIECKCSRLGFLAAFISSSSPNTSTPTPQQVSLKIQFKLDGTYDDVVLTNTKSVVETKITEAIVQKTDITEKQIENLAISRGSIQVSFTLISNAIHTTDDALLTLANRLKMSVENGSFQVLLPDGKILVALKNSFIIGELTTEAPPVSVDETGLSETEIIIIAVVCSLVGLAILVIIVIIIKKKCKSTGKVRDAPNTPGVFRSSNEAELSSHGRFNQGKYSVFLKKQL